jgi:thiol-disulfide isomerase/thioredoxin
MNSAEKDRDSFMPFLPKRSLILLGVLAAILIVAGIVTYQVFLSPTGYKARGKADLTKVLEDDQGTYMNLDGESLDLEDFRGSILVVNVWASWSPYTQSEHETLSRLKSAYGDKISVVALDRKENKETAVAYLETIGKKENIHYVIDTTDHFFSSFDGYAMPETLIFDEVGNLAFRKRGVLEFEEVEEALKSLVAK